jgi:predicted TIM-barrel fold metal-dependent hydrolase
VFGSDYPYRTAADHVKGLAPLFSAEDLKKIDRENALKLLPRWRST